MTQTLSPEDTGEIRMRAAEQTQSRAPYAALVAPMRRPDATGIVDMAAAQPIAPLGRVLDLPGPDESGVLPIVVDVADRQAFELTIVRRPLLYAGRHRPGWQGKLRRFLAAAGAPLARAL